MKTLYCWSWSVFALPLTVGAFCIPSWSSFGTSCNLCSTFRSQQSALFVSSPIDPDSAVVTRGNRQRVLDDNKKKDQDRFIRIQKKDTFGTGKNDSFDLQTCVRRYSRRNSNGSVTFVDLHAQVHFGEKEYFDYYNSEEFSSKYNYVLYELIVSDELASFDEYGNRQVFTELMPSLQDAQVASQYDLSCQLDVIKYDKPCWYCADVSKEFIQSKNSNGESVEIGASIPFEIFEALVKPTTPAGKGLKTQLFSNLFLAGDFISSILRLSLWLVPLPELSVILFDWSSLAPRPGGLSPVTFSVLESISRGDFKTARKLVFSQMIVSGQANEGSTTFIVGERNNMALGTLDHLFMQNRPVQPTTRVALLYGALHCRDLQRKLKERGFSCVHSDWRSAWNVSFPIKFNTMSGAALLIPLYLLISGIDWYDTIIDVATCADSMDEIGAAAGVAFYFARHLMLYFGLARFVLEWDGSLFSDV